MQVYSIWQEVGRFHPIFCIFYSWIGNVKWLGKYGMPETLVLEINYKISTVL